MHPLGIAHELLVFPIFDFSSDRFLLSAIFPHFHFLLELIFASAHFSARSFLLFLIFAHDFMQIFT
jgi:hypothetical protein